MYLFLELVAILVSMLMVGNVYRDMRNDRMPKWLTIPFLIIFGAIALILIADVPFSFL